jgi:hypothetical protein
MTSGGSPGCYNYGGAGGTNTGAGAGGGADNGGRGGHGGSGIIILRCATADVGTATGAETPTTSGSDTILTWKGDGSYEA